MREGPIEPGSIRELIVTIYWMGQKNAEVSKNLALIHASVGSDKVQELASQYMNEFAPYMFGLTPDKSEEMESTLKQWVAQGSIVIPRSAISRDILYGKNRAVQKFAEMRERGSKVAGRRSSLSSRDRSPASGDGPRKSPGRSRDRTK